MALTRMIMLPVLALALCGTSFAGKTPAPPKAKVPATDPTKAPAKQPPPCGTGKVPCQCSIC